MSTVDANVSLLVAALDLSLVRLLRDAIRTADLSGQATARRAAPPEMSRSDHQVHASHCGTFVGPPQHYRSIPLLALPVLPPLAPRIEYVIPPWLGPFCSDPVVAEPPPACELPIAPPWKVLAWPVHSETKVKVIHYRPDTSQKGTTIDLFI